MQQIQHPTASLIAKVATAQDDRTGAGTASSVLIIGELLKQVDLSISEGLYPRIITEGFEAAKEKALQFLEQVKVSKEMDRETLIDVARTSLRTKVHAELADVLTEVCVKFNMCLVLYAYTENPWQLEISVFLLIATRECHLNSSQCHTVSTKYLVSHKVHFCGSNNLICVPRRSKVRKS